jgi:hypothetical protein
MRRLVLLALTVATGCSDALEQISSAGQVVAVVNGADVSFVSATTFSVETVNMQTPTAAVASAAGRGTIVLVPLGSADAVAAVRTPGYCTLGTCVRQVVVLPLGQGSGATGVAIQDDSIAWVANPGLNTVTRLNYLTGDTTSRPVGVHPQAVAIVDDRVFVANGNLTGTGPAGPSWLTSFPCCDGASAPDSIALTGVDARALITGGDSLLYVIEAGHAGNGDGKVSIVDPIARTELAVVNGLGESPRAGAFHASGRLLVGGDQGILEVNTLTRSVTRGPGQGVGVAGTVSALVVDLRGRVYATSGTCEFAAVDLPNVQVLSPPPGYHLIKAVTVGNCPTAAALATTP